MGGGLGERHVRRALVPALVRALLLTALLAGLAWFVVGAIAGPEARASVLWAGGVAYLGCVLGKLVGRLVPGGRPEAAAQAALVSLGVRLFGTLILAWVALSLGAAPLNSFVLVLAVLYLALLVQEVVEAAREVQGGGGGVPSQPGPTSRDGADAS
jgi:hypothetical protein